MNTLPLHPPSSMRPPNCNHRPGSLPYPLVLPLALACWFAVLGCRSLPSLPAVNLAQPGWRLFHGQALWKPQGQDRELAGDLILALHDNGDSWIQFSKNPWPLVTAQISGQGWRVQFHAQDESWSGQGQPPATSAWLHLARAWQTQTLPPALTFSRDANDETAWSLRHTTTGETISGYLETR